MKRKMLPLLGFLTLLLFTGACQTRRCDNVVCESYVHKYGVPLSSGTEWAARGQSGQVVQKRDDGVVITRSYESGIAHGETTYTYPHRDIIQKRENYDRGTLVQETWNYANGVPMRQNTYTSPSAKSMIVWYDNGVPQAKEEYENDLLKHGEYFTINNLQEAGVNNQNGSRIRRDRYGELESVDVIQEGTMVSSTTYHPNGSPKSVTPYVNGVAEGQRLTYHPGGEPNAVETWVNGVQHGLSTEYQDGEKLADVPYKQGVRHGTESRYRDDGQTLVQQVSWMDGTKHGPTYTYVEGSKKVEWYYRDRPVNKQTYDALRNQE